jgi:hypothetical protein
LRRICRSRRIDGVRRLFSKTEGSTALTTVLALTVGAI